MDEIQKPSTPVYLPAMEALIPKQCRFCHQLKEIKQINLTEAIRLCFKCSTPYKDLGPCDVEYFHRSYRDIHKNPKDWGLNVASEEDELDSLQSWMRQVSLTVSKYEESSDDDVPSGNHTNVNPVGQRDPVCQPDDLCLEDLVSELQQGANFPDTHTEWNNSVIDELDAALAKASREKEDPAFSSFSFEDFFLPEQLPQNPTPELNITIEKALPEQETNLLLPDDQFKQFVNGKQQEIEWNITHEGLKGKVDHSSNGDIVFVTKTDKFDSTLVQELALSRNHVCSPDNILLGKPETSKLDMSSPGDKNNRISEKNCSADAMLDLNSVIQDTKMSSTPQNIMASGLDDNQNTFNLQQKIIESVHMQSPSGKGPDIDNECMVVCDTPEKEDKIICNPQQKFFESINMHSPPKKVTDISNDCILICDTPEKGTNFNETFTDDDKSIRNVDANSEFHTSTPQAASKGKRYHKLSTIVQNPEPKLTVSLNPANFVLSDQTNALTLDSTVIISGCQSETVVPQYVCDCDEEILQLSPSTQEKEDNQCIDLKLPNLSVSSIMEQDVFDDLEEDLSYFPSDLDKIIFSPKVKLSKGFLKSKTKEIVEPTKVMVDMLEKNVGEPSVDMSGHNESEPSVVASQPSTDSILLTVPADGDITPEMLESGVFEDIPILFEGLDGTILQNIVKDKQEMNTIEGCVEKSVTQVPVSLETIDHCNYDSENKQSPANPTQATLTKTSDCSQDEAAKTNLTEQFSISYSVSGGDGGFQVDVSRSDQNNFVPTVLSTQLSGDVELEEQYHGFQSKAADVLNVNYYSLGSPEPVQASMCSDFYYSEVKEEDCVAETKTRRKETVTCHKFNQPLLDNDGKEYVDDDDELKLFTGAKFSLLATRKGSKVKPESKFLNRTQIVKNEVTMLNTVEPKRKLK